MVGSNVILYNIILHFLTALELDLILYNLVPLITVVVDLMCNLLEKYNQIIKRYILIEHVFSF